MFKKKNKTISTSEEMQKSRGKSILPGAFFISLVAAVIIYLVAVNAEKTALTNYEKADLLVVKTIVPAGITVTPENASEYFEIKAIDKSIFPENAIMSEGTIHGKMPLFELTPGLAVTTNMFRDFDKDREGVENPRLMGIGTDNLNQIVSGVIRAGDLVDIYVIPDIERIIDDEGNFIDTESIEELTPIYSRVFVEEAFDSSGVRIYNDNKEAVCTRANLLVEEEMVIDFYSKTQGATIYVTKILE